MLSDHAHAHPSSYSTADLLTMLRAARLDCQHRADRIRRRLGTLSDELAEVQHQMREQDHSERFLVDQLEAEEAEDHRPSGVYRAGLRVVGR